MCSLSGGIVFFSIMSNSAKNTKAYIHVQKYDCFFYICTVSNNKCFRLVSFINNAIISAYEIGKILWNQRTFHSFIS